MREEVLKWRTCRIACYDVLRRNMSITVTDRNLTKELNLTFILPGYQPHISTTQAIREAEIDISSGKQIEQRKEPGK